MLDKLPEDLNMVQELGYESCAMFPGRQTSYNMNFAGAFGYGQQMPQTSGQYSAGPDYGQFSMADMGLQQTSATSPTTCSWASTGSTMAGMYPSTGAGSAGAVRQASPASAPGLDDWTVNTYASHPQVGGMCHTSSSTSTSPAGYAAYRPGTLPHVPSDYSPPPQHTPLGVPGMAPHHHGLSSSSPSPTGGVVGAQGSHPHGVGLAAQRVQNRAPYDWMKKQTYPTAPISGKTRTKDKYRVVYTDHQRLELEKEFHYSRYITIRRKAELAQTLSLSERQVKIWFQNRRAKERKQNKKREEACSTGSHPTDHQSQAHAHPSSLPIMKTEPMSVGQTSPLTQNISVSQPHQH